mgnify:CR=1 FL=1
MAEKKADILVAETPIYLSNNSVAGVSGGFIDITGKPTMIINPQGQWVSNRYVLPSPYNSSNSIKLTPAQYRISIELIKGISNKKIAENLSLSSRTVEDHIFQLKILWGIEGGSRSLLLAKLKEVNFHHLITSPPQLDIFNIITSTACHVVQSQGHFESDKFILTHNDREIEINFDDLRIIQLMMRAYTNEQIAHNVFLSKKAVEKRIQKLKSKFGLGSAARKSDFNLVAISLGLNALLDHL